MDIIYPSGFRILLQVTRPNETDLKCFIFLNFKKMKRIKDVEEHVKTILDLEYVSLFVNGAWLPSNETIHIIKEDDILLAKTVNSVEFESITNQIASEEVLNVKKKRRRKNNEEEPIIDLSVDLLYKQLNIKRNELEKKHELNEVEESIFKVVTKNEFQSPEVKKKKKRIRKHKKKSLKAGNNPEETTQQEQLQITEMRVPYFGKHTRFAEELADTSGEILHKATTLENTEILEDVNVTQDVSEELLNIEEQGIVSDEINCLIPEQMVSQESTEIYSVKSQKEIIENGPKEKSEEILQSNDSIFKPEYFEEEDWKTRLLRLAENKDPELKIFHRKFAKTEILETTEKMPENG